MASGTKDILSKEYFSNPVFFADAFNYLIYDGEPIIQPETLHPVDASEILLPYGKEGARFPIERLRDLMRMWAAMEDGQTVYILFGSEFQTHIHYAMPVRDMTYTGINYSAQADEARRSYKKDKGAITTDGDEVRIKLTREEFLSGFRKTDKLIPIVSAVIYLGADKWDAPTTLHEMLNTKNECILKHIPNYFINLFSPADFRDDDFQKFNTDLGFAMDAIRRMNADIAEFLLSNQGKEIDRQSAVFINEFADLHLEYADSDKGGKVDMCKSMQEHDMKTKVLATIDAFRIFVKDDAEVVKLVVKQLGVSPEYVESLMTPVPA